MATINTGISARAPSRTTGWVSADIAELAPARQQLDIWLAGRLGRDNPLLHDVLWAFSELLTYAIEGSAKGQEIKYNYCDDDGAILVRVVSQNRSEVVAALQETSGSWSRPVQGLALVENLADRVCVKALGRQVDILVCFDRLA